jgi:hypothetical protein
LRILPVFRRGQRLFQREEKNFFFYEAVAAALRRDASAL